MQREDVGMTEKDSPVSLPDVVSVGNHQLSSNMQSLDNPQPSTTSGESGSHPAETDQEAAGDDAPKGLSFTVGFDDSGKAFNLKSDLNQYLPSSRKAKLEERRNAAIVQKAEGKNQCNKTQSETCNNGKAVTSPEREDDHLSMAGTYILDDDSNNRSPESKNKKSNNVADTTLMDSFLDSAADASRSDDSYPEEKSSSHDMSKEDSEGIDVTSEDIELNTPVASDSEPELPLDSESPEAKAKPALNKSYDKLDGPSVRQPKRAQTPTYGESRPPVTRIPQSRRYSYTKPSSTENLDNQNVTSHGSHYVTMSSLKNKAPARPVTPVNRGKSPVMNQNKNILKKIDVDKKLSDMETAVKQNLHLTPGPKNSGSKTGNPAARRPPSPAGNARPQGGFSRSSPIRRSAGPRFAGGNRDADAESISSNSEDPKKFAVPRKPVIAGGNPSTAIKMNKAMKLRMMKFSDFDDNESQTSDNGSSKSVGLKPLSFSRNSPAYQSLPVKRNQSAGPVRTTPILPNKTVAKNISANQRNINIGRGLNKEVPPRASGGGHVVPEAARTPEETVLSSFDKLVLSSIDQLSKKLKMSSSQLLEVCVEQKSASSNEGAPSVKVDIPKLKTGCKEISTILYELRVVEKNIDIAYSMISPITDTEQNPDEEDEEFF